MYGFTLLTKQPGTFKITTGIAGFFKVF